MLGDVLVDTGDELIDLGFLLVASSYLVDHGRVLLVHHNGFDKWVPPGGHLNPGETFSQAAVREFSEEVGIDVRAVSAAPAIHPPDTNATAEPVPFYVDVLREGFRKPCLTQYYFVEEVLPSRPGLLPQKSEVRDARFFELSELAEIPTFAQVRSLAEWVIVNSPVGQPRDL